MTNVAVGISLETINKDHETEWTQSSPKWFDKLFQEENRQLINISLTYLAKI